MSARIRGLERGQRARGKIDGGHQEVRRRGSEGWRAEVPDVLPPSHGARHPPHRDKVLRVGGAGLETYGKVDIRLHGEGNSKLPWRKAGQPSHLVDVVDSNQKVVNKEFSLSVRLGAGGRVARTSGNHGGVNVAGRDGE